MKNKSLLLIALALAVLSVFACKDRPKPGEVPAKKEEHKPEVLTSVATTSDCTVKPQDWVREAVIYEVNVRQYTKEGTFAAFEEHLPRLKELGVDVLWFMPVQPISVKNRKGKLGSYYAIQNYTEVNAEYGTKDDFKRVVQKAQSMGFKVILDWVANHTGCDNVWIEKNPEWYVRDSVGNFKSPYDWTDTYELNYDNKEMRAAMIEAMKYWVQEFKLDGFRCDVAHELPTDFWNAARQQLETVKPIFMLAESENYDLLKNAFDANYSWKLLHMMKDVYDGKKNADSIYAYIQSLETEKCPDGLKMNFLTNHDENSWSGTESARYGRGLEAFAVLTYTLDGMPLLYTGQEVGLKKRLSFFAKDQVPSWESNTTTEFYKRLNALKHSNAVLKAGVEGGKLVRHNTEDNHNLLLFSREKGGKEILVMLNLSRKKLDVKPLQKIGSGTYTDYFTGIASDSIPAKLNAWEYKVLVK